MISRERSESSEICMPLDTENFNSINYHEITTYKSEINKFQVVTKSIKEWGAHDGAVNEIQLGLDYQLENFKRVMEDLINAVELIAGLRYIMENPAFINAHFKSHKAMHVNYYITRLLYNKRTKFPKPYDLNKLMTDDENLKYLSKLLQALLQEESVMNERHLLEQSPSVCNLFKLLNELLPLCLTFLRKTAGHTTFLKECNKDVGFLKQLQNNSQKKIRDEIKMNRENYTRKIDSGRNVLNMYTEKMDSIKKQHVARIKKIITQSEKRQVKRHETSQPIQATLSEDMKTLHNTFDKLLERNIDLEKTQRSICNKVQAQLANVTAMYDSDIGGRQTDLEEITEKIETLNKKCEVLKEKMDDINEVYMIYEEERQQLIDKIELRSMIRAVIKIQHYWRAYRHRQLKIHKQKKKAKKGKGAKGKKQKK